MQSTETLQTLLSEWPKWVATGVLIPVLQFIAGVLWKMRRKTRTAELRKNIVDLEDFIARHKAAEGKSDDTIATAEAEREALLIQLRRLSRPFSDEHPYIIKIAHALLLYPPQYAITWITRFIFFSNIAMLLLFARSFFLVTMFGLGPLYSVLVFLAVLFYNYVTRVGDGVRGPITKRPLWQRITLLYRPPNLASALSQSVCLLSLAIALLTLVPLLSDEFENEDIVITSIDAAAVAFYWYLAYHLDRKKDSEPVRELLTVPDPPA